MMFWLLMTPAAGACRYNEQARETWMTMLYTRWAWGSRLSTTPGVGQNWRFPNWSQPLHAGEVANLLVGSMSSLILHKALETACCIIAAAPWKGVCELEGCGCRIQWTWWLPCLLPSHHSTIALSPTIQDMVLASVGLSVAEMGRRDCLP